MADESSATCVAIIMDGNGRWATEHGLPVLEGHRQGARALKQTVKDAVAIGIEELTVYAFSTENWSRPDDEVSGLMEMFAELIVSETPELDEEGVRMRFVGRRGGVSEGLLEQMDWAEADGVLDRLLHRLGAAAVPFEDVETAFGGPAPVAVHDDRNGGRAGGAGRLRTVH